jgi:aryl sulfotransferase
MDLRVMPPETLAALDIQTHRRFIKTHLPADALA